MQEKDLMRSCFPFDKCFYFFCLQNPIGFDFIAQCITCMNLLTREQPKYCNQNTLIFYFSLQIVQDLLNLAKI